MRYFRPWHVILTVLTCLIVTACSADQAPEPIASDCRTIAHRAGETEVCDQPEKIVVLGGHSLDLLLSLGEQPAGLDTVLPAPGQKTVDNPAAEIPYLGEFITTQPVIVGSMGSPSLEVLTQLQPDLILGEGRNQEVYPLLSQIAPTLIWDIRTNLGQWQQNLLKLAAALGDESRGEAAIAQHHELVAQARQELQSVVASTPKILLLVGNGLNNGNLMAITPRSYLGELMTDLGFEVMAPVSEINSAPLSLEALPDFDAAERIFVLGYDTDVAQAAKAGADTAELLKLQTASIQQAWQENAIAQALTASQENQVYFVPFIKWNALNGPMGAELILADLRQLLLAG
ncbi:MAG: iron-siderophore ABC transporter substrate-binding protein [Leptolyngbya sp. SIOISBB]|nr:iron-siderophore ABC transporter substrate-binding protein [Leptolyngbya sp. SIOISBB]